jgi:hypothetical protein
LYLQLAIYHKPTDHAERNNPSTTEGGHEQLISNAGRFKSAFAQRDKKQTMIDLQGISISWFKNQLYPSICFSGLRALQL